MALYRSGPCCAQAGHGGRGSIQPIRRGALRVYVAHRAHGLLGVARLAHRAHGLLGVPRLALVPGGHEARGHHMAALAATEAILLRKPTRV